MIQLLLRKMHKRKMWTSTIVFLPHCLDSGVFQRRKRGTSDWLWHQDINSDRSTENQFIHVHDSVIHVYEQYGWIFPPISVLSPPPSFVFFSRKQPPELSCLMFVWANTTWEEVWGRVAFEEHSSKFQFILGKLNELIHRHWCQTRREEELWQALSWPGGHQECRVPLVSTKIPREDVIVNNKGEKTEKRMVGRVRGWEVTWHF